MATRYKRRVFRFIRFVKIAFKAGLTTSLKSSNPRVSRRSVHSLLPPFPSCLAKILPSRMSLRREAAAPIVIFFSFFFFFYFKTWTSRDYSRNSARGTRGKIMNNTGTWRRISIDIEAVVVHRDENKSRHAFHLYFCIGSRAIYACNERRKLEDGSSHGRT